LVNLLGELVGHGTQVFLVNGAVLAHDEGHDTRRTVLRGKGQDRKTARHLAIGDVIFVRRPALRDPDAAESRSNNRGTARDRRRRNR